MHIEEKPNAQTAAAPNGQQRDRTSGVVVSVSGSRAVIAARMVDLVNDSRHFWSVGDLITIYGATSRVICLVQDMATANHKWDANSTDSVLANAELLGEITDINGKPSFRRGISSYPLLGSPANRIRHDDLAAMYDLGDRKASVIGELSQARIPAVVDADALLRRHFAVVGTTGVGKSSAITILLRAAVASRPNARAVILDPHNEYSTAFRDIANTVAAKAFELPFWLFHFEEIVEAFYRGAPAPAEEVDFLREAIAIAREAYGQGGERAPNFLKRAYKAHDPSDDHAAPYRITDLIAAIDAELGRLEQRYSRAALRSLKARIVALCNDPSYRFMFNAAALEAQPDSAARRLFHAGDHVRPLTILQMSGIPSDVVNVAVSVMARLAFDLCVASRGQEELLLVCEEAHRYVPADKSLGFGPTRRSIARIAKEGRKYGCYIGIVTQRPAELDPTILSQCSTIFSMRLSNAMDQQIMRSAIPDNSTGALDFISSLGTREAIAFGEAVATPMRMMFAQQDAALLPQMAPDQIAPPDQEDEPAVASAPPAPEAVEQPTAPTPQPRAPLRPERTMSTLDWPSSGRTSSFGRL